MDEMTVNQLAMAAKRDERAFSLLLERMGGAINAVVGNFAHDEGKIHADDYKSEAVLGLYLSLESYDEEKGAFVTYASNAMKSQILDFIRDRQNTIRINSNMLSNMKKVREAIEVIRENGFEESKENISLFSGIASEETISTALSAMRVERCGSLDVEVKEGEKNTFADIVSEEEEWEETFLEREEERALYRVVASLPKRDRFIALHSFGIFGAEDMSNKEIARTLGCTPNTVVNRKKAITARIQEALMEWAS